MRISFDAGRAAKAAALHAVSAAREQHSNSGGGGKELEQDKGDLSDWQAVRKAANDQRGVDRWKSRGAEGIWRWWHTWPRLSVFFLHKVAEEPASSTGVHRHRFTYGMTAEGRSFEFHDDWTKPYRAHMVLDEPWLGYTVFTKRSADHAAAQKERHRETATTGRASTSRWADV